MILSRNILSLVIDGEDLVWSRVAISLGKARTLRGGRIVRALSASADEAGAGLGASSGERVMLTVPAPWCSLRPIALNVEQWAGARDEVMRSLSALLPLAPADALVGLVERRGGAAAGSAQPAPAESAGAGAPVASGAGGYLVAIDRERLTPWLNWIRRATGRDVDETISPHMAFAGLGLQAVERAEIVEVGSGGGAMRHCLRRGEIVELCRSGAGEPGGCDVRVALRSGASQATAGAPDERTVDAADLAIGAALAGIVAPGHSWPLDGRPQPRERRWAWPLAAAVIAIGAVTAASWTIESRYQAEAREIEAQQAANQDALRDVERDRTEALRLVALLEAATRGPVASSRSVLAELAAAQAALPDAGFLYRVELDSSGLSLRGEAPRASDVLQRLESTPGFGSARMVTAPAPVDERNLEIFDVRAERASGGGATSGVAR